MPSRPSSILGVPSIKQYEGHIYIANSTNMEWHVEFLTNEYDMKASVIGPNTIGAHQINRLSCIYTLEGMRKVPLKIKVTRASNGNAEEKSFKISVKNKSGLIITNTGLTNSRKKWRSKLFGSGSDDCWRPLLDKNINYNPHKNMANGTKCSVCYANISNSKTSKEEKIQEPFSNLFDQNCDLTDNTQGIFHFKYLRAWGKSNSKIWIYKLTLYFF